MLFSFLDVKTERFNSLFEATTVDEAKRIFVTLLRSGRDSMLNEYPEDFVLYQLGDFDKSLGVLQPLPAPISIMSGLEAYRICKNKEEIARYESDRQVECNTESVACVG